MRKNTFLDISTSLLDSTSDYFCKKIIEHNKEDLIILGTEDAYVDSDNIYVTREGYNAIISQNALKKFILKDTALMVAYSIGYNGSKRMQKTLRKINERFNK